MSLSCTDDLIIGPLPPLPNSSHCVPPSFKNICPPSASRETTTLLEPGVALLLAVTKKPAFLSAVAEAVAGSAPSS